MFLYLIESIFVGHDGGWIMKHNSIFFACFIFVSLIAGNFIAQAAGEASKPLIIGIPHSEAYPYATMMKNSFEMALEDINREGGIKGRPLKLVL